MNLLQDFFDHPTWQLHPQSPRRGYLGQTCLKPGEIYQKLTFGEGQAQEIWLTFPWAGEGGPLRFCCHPSSADPDKIWVRLMLSSMGMRPNLATDWLELQRNQWQALQLDPAHFSAEKLALADHLIVQIKADWDLGVVLFELE